MANKKQERVYIQIDNAALQALLKGLKTGAIEDPKSMMSMIKLNRCVTQNQADLMDARLAIAEEYKIESVHGMVSWEGHEKSDEIAEKMQALDVQEVTLAPTHFLSEEDFMRVVTPEHNISQIDYLASVLVKEEEVAVEEKKPLSPRRGRR